MLQLGISCAFSHIWSSSTFLYPQLGLYNAHYLLSVLTQDILRI